MAGLSLSVSITLITAFLITSLFSADFDPIPGTEIITQVKACDLSRSDCDAPSDFSSLSLPHRDLTEISAPTREWVYRFSVQRSVTDTGMQALYLPKFSESLSLSLNGNVIDDMPSFLPGQSRRFGRPELYKLPPSWFVAGENVFEIRLSGYRVTGSELFALYFGPENILSKVNDRRYWLTRGIARIGLFLIIISTCVLVFLTVIRRNASLYFWLIVCNLCCIWIGVAYSYDQLGMASPTRFLLTAFAIHIFLLGLLNFYSRYIDIKTPRIWKFLLALLVIEILVVLIFPRGTARYLTLIFVVAGFLSGYFIAALVWVYRKTVSRATFIVMFFSYCLMAAFPIFDSIFIVAPYRVAPLTLMPYIVATYLATILWLLGSQFLNSLRQSETLALTLQQRVDEKSAELEESYRSLAASERQLTLDRERQRIMMDLHDGVGGQLVNALAYMENERIADDVLKTTLENTLTDLSMIVDSLHTSDSVSTLLGMFRSRLEPLLARHGLEFKWEIGDEPQTANTGPAQNLGLLRIVQEAVTNCVKHAQASVITVRTDQTSIMIRDNGIGFDIDSRTRASDAGGVGLSSMERRAHEMGAAFEVESDDSGTSIKLVWPS